MKTKVNYLRKHNDANTYSQTMCYLFRKGIYEYGASCKKLH